MFIKKLISHVFILALAFTPALPGQARTTRGAEAALAAKAPALLQYTAAGHSPGFAAERVRSLAANPAYAWHAFFGAADSDNGRGITSDADGNLYVAGISYSNWNGPGKKAPLHAHAGNNDIVVIKLNPSGAYQWHTFYGSPGEDYGYAITSDPGGNLVVTGTSTDSWSGPGTESALNPHAGSNDLVVLALNASGAYRWHTFHGSAGQDYGFGINRSPGGTLYVAGYSNAGWDGPGGSEPENGFSGSGDIAVLALSSAGTYQWHTFHGSSSADAGTAVTSDADGNVYVAGRSDESWNGPGSCTTPGVSPCPLNMHAAASDLMVLKLNSLGAYQWHTFHGSEVDDLGTAITSDASGSMYVAGYSGDNWSGPGSVDPLNAYAGDNDIVVLKLDDAGAYQWHTFYGSAIVDTAAAITGDGNGGVFVAGSSYASWNGPGSIAPRHAHAGGVDIQVLALDASGAYRWHTFYGSTGDDYGYALSGDLHVAGYSDQDWNGPGAKAPLNAHTGYYDIVVIQHKYSAIFRSAGSLDGWVLESGENTNTGGCLNNTYAVLRLGDDETRKQYRAVLSFATGSLPDDAVISKVVLKVRQQSITGGGDPLTIFQGLNVGIRKGFIGAGAALALGDFQAAASKGIGPVFPKFVNGWYLINLNPARAYINNLAADGGLTQIRLRFVLDDNNDAAANYLSLYSGNAALAERPQLVIEYYVP